MASVEMPDRQQPPAAREPEHSVDRSALRSKLGKRAIESFRSDGTKTGTLFWDTELRRFGGVFPSGRKTFVVKFRNHSGRQRWLKIGAYGPLTAERARDLAKIELAKVVEGKDPATLRHELRNAMSVSQLCDLYMEAATVGLVLGRKGLPKKEGTLSTDRSRIEAHIKPLLGQLKAKAVTRMDIELFKTGVVTGKTVRDEKLGPRRRSIVKVHRHAHSGFLVRSLPGASIMGMSSRIRHAGFVVLPMRRRRHS